jgi:NAD(P)-dependent dehydrogenase (short-subunit alcohol dehydrogenase family)
MVDALTSICLVRDFVLSTFFFLCARAFPKLEVPHQDLNGKTAIITGSNSGLGFSLALSLAKRNATVYLACRNAGKAEAAAAKIIDLTGSKRVHVLELDTSLLSSVHHFAERWAARPESDRRIDILMHNAGISTSDPPFTAEGLSTIYTTNFLGSFVLTSLLENHLALDARVILTSSFASYLATFASVRQLAPSPEHLKAKPPAPSMLYGHTKFDQVAFASLLQTRFHANCPTRTAHAFGPGFAATTFLENIPTTKWYLDIWFRLIQTTTFLATSIEQGASTGLWLATTVDAEIVGRGEGGSYWERFTRRSTSVDTRSEQNLQRLWQAWCKDSGAEWQ